MNGLLIVVILIFAVCAIIGYSQGFLKITASLVTTIATILLVIFLTPYVSGLLLKAIPIEAKMQEKCMEIFLPEELLTEDSVSSAGLSEAEDSREMQISLIENANLPEIFKQLLLENNNDEIYKTLGVTKFSEYVGSYLAKLIADIAAFLLVFILATIAVRVAVGLLGIIEKIPVVGGLNRIGGGVVGLGTGLVIVWVLLIVITLMYDTELGKTCFAQIGENSFLAFLYDSNVLMNFITKFRG